MTLTIQCPQCGVVLNIPEGAQGRRLRCPKCGSKFSSAQPSTGPTSQARGVADANLTSSVLARPGEGVIPTAEGDLRETFDIPLMMEADTSAPPRKHKSADAVALFQDITPTPRRPAGAAARAKARRCTSCGGVVPPGMSLCSFCGLDLDTGQRVVLDEMLDDFAPAPVRTASIPIGVGVVGAVCLMGSLILTVLSFVNWVNGQTGYELLGLVCLFGILASVQFLRGKSLKLLVIALTLGAVIDVLVLIALPVYNANNDAPPPPPVMVAPDYEGAAPAIKPYDERLDFNRIAWGIALLMVYGVLTAYICSRPVRRHFERPSSFTPPMLL